MQMTPDFRNPVKFGAPGTLQITALPTLISG
jgi:hypothetical protein